MNDILLYEEKHPIAKVFQCLIDRKMERLSKKWKFEIPFTGEKVDFFDASIIKDVALCFEYVPGYQTYSIQATSQIKFDNNPICAQHQHGQAVTDIQDFGQFFPHAPEDTMKRMDMLVKTGEYKRLWITAGCRRYGNDDNIVWDPRYYVGLNSFQSAVKHDGVLKDGIARLRGPITDLESCEVEHAIVKTFVKIIDRD